MSHRLIVSAIAVALVSYGVQEGPEGGAPRSLAIDIRESRARSNGGSIGLEARRSRQHSIAGNQVPRKVTPS